MVSLGGKSRGINTRIVLFLIPLKVGSILGGPDLPQTRTGIKFRILTNVKFIITYEEGREGGIIFRPPDRTLTLTKMIVIKS